jgi:hypothetical protein
MTIHAVTPPAIVQVDGDAMPLRGCSLLALNLFAIIGCALFAFHRSGAFSHHWPPPACPRNSPASKTVAGALHINREKAFLLVYDNGIGFKENS